VASADVVLRHQGAFDTPFEAAREANAIDALFVRTPAQVALTIPRLRAAQFGAPYLLAAQTSALASVFIDDSGLEALPIGGSPARSARRPCRSSRPTSMPGSSTWCWRTTAPTLA
jgi:hypothetical protein